MDVPVQSSLLPPLHRPRHMQWRERGRIMAKADRMPSTTRDHLQLPPLLVPKATLNAHDSLTQALHLGTSRPAVLPVEASGLSQLATSS